MMAGQGLILFIQHPEFDGCATRISAFKISVVMTILSD